MKILFAIKAMDGVNGGAERVLADISAGLADLGHDVGLVTFDYPGGQSFYPLHQTIRRICLGIGHPHKKATADETVKRILALRKKIRQEKPDVVIAFMHSMFIPVGLALAGTGIPVIASEHIVPDHYKDRRAEFWLFLLASLFIRKITVLSAAILNTYPPLLRHKMVVMPNPVRQAMAPADVIGANVIPKIILTVGRLDPQKDQATLIEAFSKLAAKYPTWNVQIVGEGALRKDLAAQIAKLGLHGRVILAGVTTDISKEYQAAQIFALPSKYESFGLATAEGMAHGLPAIGFANCPGTNEVIIDGQTGILVSGENRAESFAIGLERLMASPDLRKELGGRARDSVAKFDIKPVIDKWAQLLKKF